MSIVSKRFFNVHSDPPTSPDLSPLRLFHRNEHSFVVFMHRERPTDEGLKPLKHLRVADFVRRAPPRSALRSDGYFSINGFRRWGTRRTVDLSALNAAAVDLDFDRGPSPPTWQQVVEVVEGAVRNEWLPLPSILVRSGRGAWLVWLLMDETDPTIAPSGRPWNQRFLRAINERIASLIANHLPQLCPDFASADLTRCLRVPGSTNSRSASHVSFLVHETPWGTPPLYTLDNLASALGVVAPSFRRSQPSLLNVELPRKRGPARGGRMNLTHLLSERLHEIELVEASRGGFREGHRNATGLVLATTLRGLHRSPDEVEDYVAEFAARCRPALTSTEIRWLVNSSVRPYRFGNATIARQLGVSVEESDALGLRHIRPNFRPKNPEANISKGRRESAARRRAALRLLVDGLEGRLPSLRELSSILAVAVRTAARDLDSLGIARSRKRGRSKSPGTQLPIALAGRKSTSRV